jgi:predicted DNA binding CopG/RHH family protein
MTPDTKIKGTPDAWDNGELGRDEKHVRRSKPERETSVEDSLDLQMISIRLQRELIKELKFIARFHGIGYQPLIRDVLGRFTRSEMANIAEEYRKKTETETKLKAEKSRKRA